jgi:predicted ABC-type sugar transport system permease subunit
VITFGISIAPFIFTKIMKVVLRFAPLLLVHGTNCIDDNLWAEFAPGTDEVKAIVQLVFAKLGWVFNEKCEFTSSTTVLYNGMWIDSKRFEIRATDEKVDAARRLAWTMWYVARDGEQVCLRDLQPLVGRLQI